MNFWDNSIEFGRAPGDKRSSWVMLTEEATANTKDIEEKTEKSKQRQLFLACPPSASFQSNRANRRTWTLHPVM